MSVDWTPDGSRIAAVAKDGVLAVWDTASDRQVWSSPGTPSEAATVRISPDGSRMAVANDAGQVRFYASADGAALGEVSVGPERIDALAFAGPDQLYVGVGRGVVHVVDIATRRVAPSPFAVSGGIGALAYAAGRLAIGSNDGRVKVVELVTGRTLMQSVGASSVNTMSLSADGRVVAFGDLDGRVVVHDVDRDRPLVTMEAHADSVHAVELDAAATHVISAGLDGHIRYWDLGGRLLFDAATTLVWSARLGPDGVSLATVGDDHVARIWSLAPDARSRVDIQSVMDCWSRFRLVEQRLVPHEPRCVTPQPRPP
jgi:WD40 repeat protein